MLSPGDQVILDDDDHGRRVTVTLATHATDPRTGNRRPYYVGVRNCNGEQVDFWPDRITGHWVEL
jgi:hypothetical protein